MGIGQAEILKEGQKEGVFPTEKHAPAVYGQERARVWRHPVGLRAYGFVS